MSHPHRVLTLAFAAASAILSTDLSPLASCATAAEPAFSEDFGFFQDAVPGVFWFLGVNNSAKGTVGMPHSPNYVADEGAILVAARAMTAVMLDRLKNQP